MSGKRRFGAIVLVLIFISGGLTYLWSLETV